ncbi:TIGR02678 family protein [Kibdelosporangium philippinense]|uniref:TIGR02678 family protein n=1 Tax=Kibdelosporangium philippinense TaxID=211113 RepID=A0ABS8ZKL7_9PSEU|nr:TIGR02678 family protein [Kibdelosporangium philippinense]MCE7008355.1 TIGR02678 family protein [Kibdelosporangium philippinense]
MRLSAADPLDGLADIDAANVVRCARTLLRRPLLRLGGPDGELLPLVYRHRVVLGEMFTAMLGYRLVVERKFARLYKAGPGEDSTRGVQELSPRGYAYVALTMAALTGTGRQVLLSRLVSDVRAAAIEAGMQVVDTIADRRALTAALRHLVSLGVLTETEGTVGSATSSEAPAEALITIETDLLGQLLAGPVSDAQDAGHLVTLAARTAPRRVDFQVRRKIVETPVVLYADLAEDEREWLLRNQRRESYLLERCFGLYTETRLEGILAADPEEYLSDVMFPGTSTVARIGLLALPDLLSKDSEESEVDSAGRSPVTADRVREVCERLVTDYPAAWSRQAAEDLDGIVTEVLALFVHMGLAVADGERWWLSPAAARWWPEPDGDPERDIPEPAPEPEVPGWSLFDEEGGA